MNELYPIIKAKILSNVENLQAKYDPTPEQENTLLELTKNIEFLDIRKKIKYKGRNRDIIKCFIPKDLLIVNERRLL